MLKGELVGLHLKSARDLTPIVGVICLLSSWKDILEYKLPFTCTRKFCWGALQKTSSFECIVECASSNESKMENSKKHNKWGATSLCGRSTRHMVGQEYKLLWQVVGVGWGQERRKATNKIDTLTPYQSILLLNLVVSASNNSLYLSRRATQIVLKLLGLGNRRELPSSWMYLSYRGSETTFGNPVAQAGYQTKPVVKGHQAHMHFLFIEAPSHTMLLHQSHACAPWT